ncbi:MAG: class I tRNA ligase family protein, partial [Candidatus Binatia bacterium]
ESPLATVKEWVEVKCPNCPRIGRRETNTMPQWAGSSWYWLRYVSPHYDEGIADPKQLERWLPVDLYIGGSEHAVLHLLYARFWQKALVDAGVLHHDEPFKRFRAVGLVIGEDGQKMSKSRGNVINPDDVVAEYGADTLRIYEMFMGPFENSAAWSTEGIRGARRFVERVWNMIHAQKSQTTANAQEDDAIHLKLHQTIKRVTESTEQFRFNTAIAALMEFLNVLEKTPAHHIATLETFVLLLAPYAPHVAEELWEVLGRKQSLAYEKWPQWNNHVLAMAKATIPVQVNGKVRGELQVQRGMSQPDIEHQAKTIENVQRFLAGKNIQKVIYVPDRLVNFVLTE